MGFHFVGLGGTNRLFCFNFPWKVFVNIYSMRVANCIYLILLYLQHLIKFCNEYVLANTPFYSSRYSTSISPLLLPDTFHKIFYGASPGCVQWNVSVITVSNVLTGKIIGLCLLSTNTLNKVLLQFLVDQLIKMCSPFSVLQNSIPRKYTEPDTSHISSLSKILERYF